MQRASFVKRFGALLVDMMIQILAILFFMFLVGIPFVIMVLLLPESDEPPMLFMLYFIFYVIFICVLPYFISFYLFVWYPHKHNGQTIGKKMLSIRTVKNDGTDLSLGETFLRSVILDFIKVITWITILFGDQKRMLHDIVTDTTVVNVQDHEISVHAEVLPIM